jgi:Tol biopolymer transport system component
LGEYLNPRNDIWLADSVTGEPLKRLTNADGFDGFPTVSHDSKTNY